jgi:hypothetical protein
VCSTRTSTGANNCNRYEDVKRQVLIEYTTLVHYLCFISFQIPLGYCTVGELHSVCSVYIQEDVGNSSHYLYIMFVLLKHSKCDSKIPSIGNCHLKQRHEHLTKPSIYVVLCLYKMLRVLYLAFYINYKCSLILVCGIKAKTFDSQKILTLYLERVYGKCLLIYHPK